jgi:L-rhamnose mutarotase
MGKVIFSIQYEVKEDKREEYLNVTKELKNLLKAEGLETYQIYEVKGKKNLFNEIYTFASEEHFDNFDDDQDERINILINKVNDLSTGNGTKYTTMLEVE